MAKRKTLRSLDISIFLSAFASVVAMITMCVVVHETMWAHVPALESAASPAKPVPATRVRISSKTVAA